MTFLSKVDLSTHNDVIESICAAHTDEKGAIAFHLEYSHANDTIDKDTEENELCA